MYYAYWSMCQLHSAAHVIFLLFHVSSFGCSTCRFPRVPRFFSLMVHLSCAYWSMCQFRVPMCHFAAVPRVVFLEFHMSISDQPTFAFIEDTCSFLDVTRAIHVIPLLENMPSAPTEKGQRNRFLNRCPATATNGLALRHRIFQPVP